MSKKYPGGFVTNLGTVGASVYFDGTGDYLTIPANTAFNFGTGNFTIELYFYRSGIKGNAFHDIIMGNRPGSLVVGQWYLYVGPAIGGTFAFQARTSGGDITVTGGVCVENSWNHLAVVKNGTSLSLFLNGTNVSSTTTSVSIGDSSSTLSLAAFNDGTFATIGYISNVRIVKGTALYTAAFTPPTQLLNVTNTSLLTCQSPTIVDNSSNNFTISGFGNTAVSTFTPFPVVNPAPTSSSPTTPAPGVWTLDQALQYTQQGVWPTAASGFIGRTITNDSSIGRVVVISSANMVYAVGDATESGVVGGQISAFTRSGIQWQRRLTSTGNTVRFYGAAVAASGNLYVGGQDGPSGGGNESAYLLKYNSSGTLLWQRRISGTAGTRSFAYGVFVDSSENIFVVGPSDAGVGFFYGYLLKFDSNGNLIFGKRCTGTQYAAFQGVALANSGNIYCAGAMELPGFDYDPIIVKYNSSGVIQWQRRINSTSPGTLFGFTVAIDSNEDVYMVGLGNTADFLTKYNSSGTIQWSRQLSSFTTRDVAVDAEGNVYVTGSSSSLSGVSVQKFNSSGTYLFGRQFYMSSSQNQGFGIRIVGSSMFISGQAPGISGNAQLIVGQFPTDGSLTGTYTIGGIPITYTTNTISVSAITLSDTASAFSDLNAGFTISTGALTETTPTFSSPVVAFSN